VTFEGPREVSVREYEDPSLGPNEVRLKTLFSGISAGTEMTAYRGSNPYLAKRWEPERRLFALGLANDLHVWVYGEPHARPPPHGRLVVYQHDAGRYSFPFLACLQLLVWPLCVSLSVLRLTFIAKEVKLLVPALPSSKRRIDEYSLRGSVDYAERRRGRGT